MRILINAPFSTFSGYGNDGIGMALAFLSAGHDVYLQPTHVDAPLPPAIAALLTKPLEAPFDLAIVHVDPAQLEASPEMRRAANMVVGWTMWEYTSLDNLYANKRTLRKRLKNFDALIAYDRVTAEAFRPYLGTDTGLVIQQGGYDADAWPEVERDWFDKERFAYCMVGALHDRKDPFLAIQAFRELKAEYPEEFEPAELHLKTNIPGLHPKMEDWTPKLRIHYAIWSADVLREFYKAMHVLLAPSHGEGKNMPALEMLSTGGTVIATNWGGHTQWLTNDIGYKLDYRLVGEPKHPTAQSARADKDSLKALMLEVFRHRSQARNKGALAATTIPTQCSWEAVIEHLFHRLRAAPNGERTYLLSKMIRRDEDMPVRL